MQEVPEEIWCHIFTFACTDYIRVRTLDDQLWTLRQVSSWWRAAIDYTPILWNRWEFTYDDRIVAQNRYHYHPSQVETYPKEVTKACTKLRLKLCLQNSTDLPLSIKIKDNHTKFDDEIYESLSTDGLPFDLPQLPYDYIISRISSNLYRCVNLTAPCEFFAKISTKAIKPDLSTIPIIALNRGITTLNILHGAAALQEMHFSNLLVIATDFPLSQVKKLSFNKCEIYNPEDRIYNIFKNAPLLEELEWVDSLYLCDNDWSLAYRDPDLEDITEPATLPFLHTMRIDGKPWILPMLCTPSLKVLELEMNKYPNPENVFDLAERSKCKFKYLRIVSESCPKFFQKLLPQCCLDDIEEVCLINCYLDIDGFFVRKPKPKPLRVQILPSMRKLQLYEEKGSPFRRKELDRMKFRGKTYGVNVVTKISDRWQTVNQCSYYMSTERPCSKD